MKENRRYESDFVAVLLSGLLFGTLAIFAALLSDTGMNAITQAMWRLAISVPIFALIMVMFRVPTLKIVWRDIVLFLLQGLLLYLAAIGYIASITMGTPANLAGFLGNMQPIFTIVLSGIILRERIAPLKIIAAGLSIIGAGLLLGYNGLSSIHIGGVVALGSSVLFAGYIIMNGRFAASRKYHALSIVFWTLVGATVSSVAFGFAYASTSFNIVSMVPQFSQQQWLLLLGFSVLSTVLPYMLFTRGVRTVDAPSASIVLLSTPIATAIMGALVLQETLAFFQIAGAGMIILGVLIIGAIKS